MECRNRAEQERRGDRVSDLISRQAVLDILKHSGVWHDRIEAIEALPSAESEIICCEDCKFNDGFPPIADGRYWCLLHSCYMYFCSDAERWSE